MNKSNLIKPKILHYYSSSKNIGGPLSYINTIINSELKSKYEFVTCFQNLAPKGINLSLLYKMVNTIREIKPDIIHVHGLQSEGLYGLLAGKINSNNNILMTIHGLASDAILINPIKKALYKYFVEPYTLYKSDYVYCVCDYAKNRKYISQNSRNLLNTIHTGINLSIPLKEKEEIRAELNLSNGDFIGVITGRVVVDKGFEYLNSSIKHFYKLGHNRLRFLIVGDGEYLSIIRNELSQEISSNFVQLLGRRNDISDILNASDFFIFPSLHENLSISLLEACASGLPIIATNVGGNTEIIANNYSGILIPPYDSDTIIESINFLLNNPKIAKEMGRNSKLFYEEKFTIQKMISKLDKVYLNILNETS